MLASCQISAIRTAFFCVWTVSRPVIGGRNSAKRVQHSVMNFPAGLERQTVLNLLAEQEALELVCEPFSDLEPSLAVYRALHKLFFG
jgi:hypothetical protein